MTYVTIFYYILIIIGFFSLGILLPLRLSAPRPRYVTVPASSLPRGLTRAVKTIQREENNTHSIIYSYLYKESFSTFRRDEKLAKHCVRWGGCGEGHATPFHLPPPAEPAYDCSLVR